MDFHALSRRELQALCKRNRVRANMTNAAMAQALQSLPSVDGVDEIGRTAPPGMSQVETKAEEKRQECPQPRGSCARAKTRRAAAHKVEEAVPARATLPGSHLTAEREAAVPVEAEAVATAKRRTRRSTRSKVKMSLDLKEEMAAAAGKEPIADSSEVAIGSAVLVSDQSCDDPKEEGVVAVAKEGATKPQEGIVEEQEPISTVHKFASLITMEDSPVLSIWSKAEATEPVIEMEQGASVGEMIDEINPDIEDKAAAAEDQAVKEDGFTTDEADQLNVLVNTLDRFVKPIYEFTVKEKKEGECWWMLM